MSNDSIANTEMEITREEAAMALFQVLSQNLPGGIEDSQNGVRPGWNSETARPKYMSEALQWCGLFT
jgi:hypothetical protein